MIQTSKLLAFLTCVDKFQSHNFIDNLNNFKVSLKNSILFCYCLTETKFELGFHFSRKKKLFLNFKTKLKIKLMCAYLCKLSSVIFCIFAKIFLHPGLSVSITVET